jgi:very-short-patch-repair endonuclease
VYATFSGELPRGSTIWAALLAAGRDAVVSHHTAAELVGLTDRVAPTVHVTIPSTRRVTSINGVAVHVSAYVARARHPTRRPPQTRVEETVLDLIDASRSADDVVAWLTAAIERRLTTPARLAVALDLRAKIRWRREIASALSDVASGCRSVLESRYLRDVERAHRLPPTIRQAPHERIGGRIYDDLRYARYGVVVELDGRVAHPADVAFRDLRRDNVAGERGDSVLHYGWSDVTIRPCEVARQVASVVARRGWTGQPNPCRRPDCVIRKT